MQDLISVDVDHSCVASICMLFIIDLNSMNVTCISSCFIKQQAKLWNVPTACVKSDQPLWLKAVDIVQSCKLFV
jgi:hypothetical protein